MRGNLENEKKAMAVRIVNSVWVNSMNIVNNVGIFLISASMNSIFI